MGSGYLFDILTLILAPLGLQAFANEILFGLWCMAAPIAAIFVPRVGSATIGEVLAALAEVLYGSQFGLGALLSGLVQGLGSELGFIVTKNRYESWLSLIANSIGITLFSFVYEYIKLGYYAFSNRCTSHSWNKNGSNRRSYTPETKEDFIGKGL